MPESKATFGGGCFWCLEAVFVQLRGVAQVVSGYAGGAVDNPTYRAVCGGGTGHAEVVQITFDPAVISFRDLLDVFFATHDPTTRNRQGNDVGTQYRSAVFYDSEEQKLAAEEATAAVNASGDFPNPVVTEVVPLTRFWPAEDYHQNYYADNPDQPYCQLVVGPKAAKARKLFADRLRTG